MGTGSKGGDETNNITIEGNDISQTTTEGIDIKPYVSNVVVDRNKIYDINTGTSGALVIGLPQEGSTGGNFADADNVIVGNNKFWNIFSDSGRIDEDGNFVEYTDGNAIRASSGATIYNNEISNFEHRGIFIEVEPENPNNQFNIYHNTVYRADGENIKDSREDTTEDIEIEASNNTDIQNNIGYKEGEYNIASSADLFANPSVDPAPDRNNLELKAGSTAVDAGDAIELQSESIDLDTALNNIERSGENAPPRSWSI